RALRHPHSFPTRRSSDLAFHADGQGYTSDIIRAIYYAMWKGAKVLNMSFSSPTSSPEIKRALDYATSRGLIPVASVGNGGSASRSEEHTSELQSRSDLVC